MSKLSILVVAIVLLASAASAAATLYFTTLNVPTTSTVGTATAVGALERKAVQVEGAFSGTLQTQISLSPTGNTDAGTTSSPWTNEGSAFSSGGGTLEITKPCAWVRLNRIGTDGGTPTARVAGVSRQ